MDVLFHFGSASLLAYGLDERRPKYIVAAGALGMLPDLLWLPAHISGSPLMYTIPHSLVFNIAVCAAIGLYVNWKIAFGPLLHISIDVFTHASSTKHILYPFFDMKLLPSVSWWSGYGLILWASLWAFLIALAVSAIAWNRRMPKTTGH